MDRPVPDHRGPEMPSLVAEIRAGLRGIFKSEQAEPVIFPGSGTGAWEASLVNTLSPGERVLTFQNGHFARLYAEAARQLGMKVDEVKLRWGDAVTPRHFHHLWLSEGFASYFDLVVGAALHGDSVLKTGLRRDAARDAA